LFCTTLGAVSPYRPRLSTASAGSRKRTGQRKTGSRLREKFRAIVAAARNTFFGATERTRVTEQTKPRRTLVTTRHSKTRPRSTRPADTAFDRFETRRRRKSNDATYDGYFDRDLFGIRIDTFRYRGATVYARHATRSKFGWIRDKKKNDHVARRPDRVQRALFARRVRDENALNGETIFE